MTNHEIQKLFRRIIHSKLSLMILLMTFWVFFSSLIHYTGRITGDAFFYLKMAKVISHGSFFVGDRYETLWPYGWPLVIAVIKTLLFTDVWLTSKLLLITFFGLSSYIILMIFKEDHLPLVFFFSSYLFIFNESNSEAQFIFIELLCFYLTLKYIQSDNLKYLYLLPLATFSAYATRYYGLFTNAFIAYIFFYNIFHRRRIKPVIFASAFSIVLPICYMFVNSILSGEPVGPRADSGLSILQYIQNICESFSLVFNPFIDKIGYEQTYIFHMITLPIFIAFLLFFRKKIFHKAVISIPELDRLLIFTCIIYVLPLTVLRYFKYFSFDIRLLAPGTLFFLLFALRRMTKQSLYIICALSLTINIAKVSLHTILVDKPPFYKIYIESIIDNKNVLDSLSNINGKIFTDMERDTYRNRIQKNY